MKDKSGLWKNLRKKARAIFCKDSDDCSKEKRRILKRVLTGKNHDLEKRLGRLKKAYKKEQISKKQYRLAKKLIIASYDQA